VKSRPRWRVSWAAAPAVVAVTALGGFSQVVEAQTWRTVTMSRQHDGESSLDVRIRYGVGRLDLRSAEPGLLYSMRLRYDEEVYEPVADYEGNRLRLGVDVIQRKIRVGERDHVGQLDVALARGVPTDLDLEFGAGRADLDLGGLSLTRLDLRTGASETRLDVSSPNPERMRDATIEVGAAEFSARKLGNLNAAEIVISAGVGQVTLDFTGEWRRDADVVVDMGLGSLELRFPEGIGVRLRKNTFLTAFDSEGLIKRGDSYYSPDWDEAEHRITLDVDAAFGSIEVAWVR